MDEKEFDIYDDLDVYEDSEQHQKNADYLELEEQLKECQDVIRQLQEDNTQLREQISLHEKTTGTLETNHSSLLITAKAEIKRKDEQIHELRKEKDNIVFRRKDKLQKSIQTQSISTQTYLTGKQLEHQYLKRIDEDSQYKSNERNWRDDNRLFSSKDKEHIEVKANNKNRENSTDKNENHRHQLQHQDDYNNSRRKYCSQRGRDDRDMQIRSKRRRSRSASKDWKKARRSRSRSRRQERNSPDKANRNQRLHGKIENKDQLRVQSPKHSSAKVTLEKKRPSKSSRHSNENSPTKFKTERSPEKRSNEKELPTPNGNSEQTKNHETIETKAVNMIIEKDALEEGEIDDIQDLKHKCEDIKLDSPQIQIRSTLKNIGANKKNHPSKISIKTEIKDEFHAKIEISPNPKDTLKNEKQESPSFVNETEEKFMLKSKDILSNDFPEVVSNDTMNGDSIVKEENMVLTQENPIKLSKTVQINNSGKNIASNITEVKAEVIEKVKLEEKSLPSENISQQNICDTCLDNETKPNPDPIKHPMPDGSNSVVNNIANKSVTISTSSKDYLIVDENNETTIYVTRKKKKKKKSL